MKMIDSYSVKLQPLTPIHIGSGEEIFPYDYVIKNEKFYKIDLDEIYENLDEVERRKFEKYAEEDIVKLRNFISQIYNEEFGYIYKSDASKSFVNKYNDKLDGAKSNEQNKLTISTFSNSFDRQFIPGTSVKGAIRSAFLLEKGKNHFDYSVKRGKRIDHRGSEYRKDDSYKKEILNAKTGNFAKVDPFRMLKVSDSVLLENQMIINEVFVMKYFKDRQEIEKTSEVREECTKSLFGTGDEFQINLKIDFFNELYHKGRNQADSINMLITKEDILKSLKNKSKEILEKELEFYNKSRNSSNICDIYLKLRNIADTLSDNESLIRLGKGTGFDDKTFNLGNKRMRVDTITRSLAEKELPMGWAVISFGEDIKLKKAEKVKLDISNKKHNTSKEDNEKEVKVVPKVKEKSLKIIDVDNKYFILEDDKKVTINEFMVGKPKSLRRNVSNMVGKSFIVKDYGDEVVEFIKMGK